MYNTKYNNLNYIEEEVIENKATEPAFSGQYDNFYLPGTYICRKCNQPLFPSKSKFDAGCGWPAYDDHFDGSVISKLDKDGVREEIICSNCNAHLGHLFKGEKLTPKNTRHCVNSVSILFIPEGKEFPKVISFKEVAIFAGGCFWCTEAVFTQLKGVIYVEPGYIGGDTVNPTYQQVSTGTTNHAEAVRISYDSSIISFDVLLEIFFATHNPTTLNRQGNDIGTQYRSEIFYMNDQQRDKAQKYIESIQKDYPEKIVTKLSPASDFYPAEEYHKEYYFKNKYQPYCMLVVSPKVLKVINEYRQLIN